MRIVGAEVTPCPIYSHTSCRNGEAIFKCGKLPFVSIEDGVKINAVYYKKKILQKLVRSRLEKMYIKDDFELWTGRLLIH